MVTTMTARNTKKGQYFSFDAIMASVIFILALTLLSSHWFSLRAQIDDRSDYLQTEAFRISDALLGPGDPPNWYFDIPHATRVGLSVNSSLPSDLNLDTLQMAQGIISSDERAYNASRNLLGTGADYWVEVNTTYFDRNYQNFTFGRRPLNPTEIAKVRREIVVKTNSNPNQIHYYPGNMTLYLWTNKTRT